jgi:small subunit ribosomal protein S9
MIRMAQTKSQTEKSKNAPVAHGVGRRKSSVARAWIRRGKGAVTINKLDISDYFDTVFDRETAATAIRVLPIGVNYDYQITVKGGGKVAQADAVKLAIARGFLSIDENLRPELRKYDLLTVDDRVKERKKYGRKAARRSFQFVKR